MFLTASEVDELTGIKTGRNGKSKVQLQCEHLRSVNIPFTPSVTGAPKVPKSYFDGKTIDKPAANWQPAVLRA